ncbi:MAG: phosphoesterase [Desulfatitalea sp.]|nr:DHH family phosphoesterase [Desulfatitalea sp.]NNJ98982.1 phosphoesterase [Desulfatitalea sp.]
MSLSTRERLRRLYALFSGEDHVLICIVADPDAIASAMALKRLLWRKVAQVTIAHVNEIERTDNLVFIRLIGVKMIPLHEVDASRFTRHVFLDGQPDHHPGFSDLIPAAIIDHHPVTPTGQAAYVDIRPKYGATATILIEYLRAAKIKPSTKLATALYYAIKTDTSNFERDTVIEDLNAFQFVFRLSNIALARRIESAEIPLNFLKYFKRALDMMQLRKGRALVHLGPVIHPDVCVQIADFLMHIDSVNWSIVSGTHQRKLVVIFRNDGIRKDAGKIAKQSFGRFGSAGGHKSAARAEIPMEALAGITDAKDINRCGRWIVQRIERNAGQKQTNKEPPA